VPELAVDPGHSGDKAPGLDAAKNGAGLRIDLVDLLRPILAHPERSLSPCEPRIAAAAGRRDRPEHATGFRIDLLDAVLGDLKQILPVERRSGMRRNLDRADRVPTRRLEGVQSVAGRKPDVRAVKRQAMNLVDAGKGSILAHDFGC
jgi:hypothetical protein